MWKSENKRNANGQHEPISVNADLERIALPIRFSYQELVATTGSFEIVESSVKEGLDKFIKKPWVGGGYHVTLMRLVWELHLAGTLMDAADQRLNMDFDANEMHRLMMVGLWCTHPNNKERPKAGQVIQVLQLDMPVPELPHDMHDSILQSLNRIESNNGHFLGICLIVTRKLRKKRNKRGHESISVNTNLERGALPKRFSHQELVAATGGFANGRKLGQGGSGQIYKGTLTDIDRLVAVKRIFAGSDHSERIFINEVKIISHLIHRNLVQFIGWCHEQDEFLLVYEYMSNGSLDSHLFGNKKNLPWNVRYKISLELASAVHYLNEDAEQCVLHRDIKSANILLGTDFSTKLGDFGVAKLVDRRLRTQMTGVIGTYGYLAPEYANGGRASKESDMYSFGVVALEIACGRRTYQQGEYHVPLMRWVWELYLTGNIMDAVDERLKMDFDSNQMERLIIVGLWCTHSCDKERPKAGQVIKVLQLDMPMPEVPHDMHDQAFYSFLPSQQSSDSFQSPATSSIKNAGR
ncbi:hypothetical protein FEM48_Zijuj06G0066100 [Ziziphus jujuba var. spinosa]|uniref:Protein kinase domain-containing protein n=1 Tax=Ziziphus jujuba var. spinosa TaxID=714518 RepID=A0A978V7R2_ZIZJJ|nr:hypothetical protein FEM48_Zijuj06G0066100 [Ziziphus jujuba var. spinosa]